MIKNDINVIIDVDVVFLLSVCSNNYNYKYVVRGKRRK